MKVDVGGSAVHGGAMKIASNKVATIEYSVRSEEGDLIDSSGEQPMAYLHGHAQIIPGLEKALEGLAAGEKTETTIGPDEGYGARDENKVVKVERSQLPDDLSPEIGMILGATGPDGQTIPLWVVGLEDDTVVLDGNHPLAGRSLSFEAEVKEVREATPEELQHGHAHGEGGAH